MGGYFVRLGPLFMGIVPWVAQTGACLGLGLHGQPVILGKLLGVDPEKADEYVKELEGIARKILAKASTDERSILTLFSYPDLEAFGVYPENMMRTKTIRRKCDSDFAARVTDIAFSKGAAIGYYHPDIFRECWESTYRMRSEDEWQKWRLAGLNLQENQTPNPLESGIAAAAETVLEWCDSYAPGYLLDGEIAIIKSLT